MYIKVKKIHFTILISSLLFLMSFSFGQNNMVYEDEGLMESNSDVLTYGFLLEEINLVKGFNGNLHEENFLKREELITLISRLYETDLDNFEPPSSPTFKDVSKEHWAYKNIEFAYIKGITDGIGNDKFGLGYFVNYNQASLFLARTLGYDVSELDYHNAAESISQSIELNTIYDVKPMDQLRRKHVFELIAKTLMLEQSKGGFLIDKIGLNEGVVNKYASDFYNVYDQSIIKNLDNEQVEIRYSNGDVYRGFLKNGLFDGQGSYYYNNGDLYLGFYSEGQRNGYGIYNSKSGSIYDGMWENNEFLGESQISKDTPETYSYNQNNFSLNEDIVNYELKFIDENDVPVSGLTISITSIPNLSNSVYITDTHGLIYLPLKEVSYFVILKMGLTEAYSFSYDRRNISRTLFKYLPEKVIKVHSKSE